MSSLEIIEKATGVIYHELGHFFGYALANYAENSYLGEVIEFSIGNEKSCVGVENSYYHYTNLKTERNKIYTNTGNKIRTVSWFIETISGCTFQTIFEGKSFNNCFGYESLKGGNIDYSNILAITKICDFKFNMYDIFDLQSEYANLVIKYDLIQRFSPAIQEIKDLFITRNVLQIDFSKNEINYFNDFCRSIITMELYEDYKAIINNF